MTDIVDQLNRWRQHGQAPKGEEWRILTDAVAEILRLRRNQERYEFWRNACAEADDRAQAIAAELEQLRKETNT